MARCRFDRLSRRSGLYDVRVAGHARISRAEVVGRSEIRSAVSIDVSSNRWRAIWPLGVSPAIAGQGRCGLGKIVGSEPTDNLGCNP
jgi:hypothetical protein